MCAPCEASKSRHDASAALLNTCIASFGDALKAAFPVDHDLPDSLRNLLEKL